MDIVTREQWGARPPKSRRTIPTPVQELWLHHSAVGRSGAGEVRSIQNYHMDTKGWADIGYSWLYSPDERLFYEGRGGGVAGAHTEGHNRIGHGLCVMGNFDKNPVSRTTVEDLGAFARWHARYGLARFTGGHRDVGTTSCPGSNLYRALPDINAAAAERGTDMTPEQEQKLDQAHEALARIDTFLQLSGLMNPDGSPVRHVARDLQLTRIGIRTIAAKLGIPTKHTPDDDVAA